MISGCFTDVNDVWKDLEKKRKRQRNDLKFCLYFKTLGYTIEWDKNQHSKWYELWKDGKMVSQIDMNIDLDHIIEDMCCFHEQIKATSPSNYEIRGDALEELFTEVYEKEHLEYKMFFFHNNSYGSHYTILAYNKPEAHKALLDNFKALAERAGNLIGETERANELYEEWKDFHNLPEDYVIDVYYANHVLHGCNS